MKKHRKWAGKRKRRKTLKFINLCEKFSFRVINYTFLSWVSLTFVHKWCCFQDAVDNSEYFSINSAATRRHQRNLKVRIFFITIYSAFHIFHESELTSSLVDASVVNSNSKSLAELFSYQGKLLSRECDGEYIIITSRRGESSRCYFGNSNETRWIEAMGDKVC